MSELNGKNRHDYSKYDEMSTEALEQILRLDFQASGDSESDIDAILYISEVIAKRKELSAEGDVDAAWERFKTKYLPYADGRSLYDFDDEDSVVSKPTEPQPNHSIKVRNHSRRHRPHHLLRLRRLLTVAVIVVACLFGGVMVAQAAGIDVLGAIGRWTENAFSFGDVSSQSNQDLSNVFSNQSAQLSNQEPLYKIAEFPDEWEELQTILEEDGQTICFPEIPSTFVLVNSDLYVDSTLGDITFFANYEDGEHFLLFQVNQHRSPPTTIHEKDGSSVEIFEYNGVNHYIFDNLGVITAVWMSGNIEYSILTDSQAVDMKELIESAY